MSKFKAYRGAKRSRRQTPNSVPCLIIVALGLVLLLMLFYSVIRST